MIMSFSCFKMKYEVAYFAEYDVTKEKQRLQNLMTYGSDLEPEATAKHTPSDHGILEEVEERDRFDEGTHVHVHIFTRGLKSRRMECFCVV